MDYTIKQFATLAEISTRTLRYYDEIDLLHPNYVTGAGYRIYGENEVDRLQHILFFRALDFPLETIKTILANPDYDSLTFLEKQKETLLTKQRKTQALIAAIDKTIAMKKGEITMNDQEKFEVFKQRMITENEQNFGKEIREKYGEASVTQTNKRWQKQTASEFQKMNELEAEMVANLEIVSQTNNLDSEEALAVYEKHKKWLLFSWQTYSAEAHSSLAEMYVADSRFSDYYDQKLGKKITPLLRDIIVLYAK